MCSGVQAGNCRISGSSCKMTSPLGLSDVISRIKPSLQSMQQRTLTSGEVAHAFREPFILTGYRLPNQSWWFYCKSFFSVHNETVNAWSHAAAALLVLANIWEFSQIFDFLHDKYGWSVIGFSLGCLFGTSLSTIAHQFHSKSVWWHYVLFMIDYGGVTLYTFGTGLGCIYICSQKEVYRYLEPFFLPLNAFLSWMTFYICCRAKIRFNSFTHGFRLAIMVAAYFVYALIISIPVFGRYAECLTTPGCSLMSLNHLTVCFLLIALSAVLFACHVPERFAPGWFDIVGHGHSLFHLVSFITITMQMEGVRKDIREGAAAHTHPSLWNIMAAYGILITAQILTIVYLRHDIARRVKEDEAHWQSVLAKNK